MNKNNMAMTNSNDYLSHIEKREESFALVCLCVSNIIYIGLTAFLMYALISMIFAFTIIDSIQDIFTPGTEIIQGIAITLTIILCITIIFVFYEFSEEIDRKLTKLKSEKSRLEMRVKTLEMELAKKNQ